MLEGLVGDAGTAQCVKQPVPHSILQPPHFLLCDDSSLIVLPDAAKSGDLGLDFRHIPGQFLLNLIAAILPTGESLIQRATSLTVEGVDTAANQKIFFTDNAAADVMAGVQSCHVVGLQQHLQTVCCVLLGDGEGSVREFSGQIAYHTVIVLLIEGPIRADGVRDQLLHQPLVIVKLIQCGGVCLRGVPFQFGEKKVDEVMDGGIEHDNIIDISLIAGHLEFVIPPLVLPTSRHDEEKKWPEELEAALKEIIAETGATSGKDMGKVMGVASKKLAGLAEGRAISAKVKELLG